MPRSEYRWLSEWNNHSDEMGTQAKQWKQVGTPLWKPFLTPFVREK
jgi:hypothetical protein